MLKKGRARIEARASTEVFWPEKMVVGKRLTVRAAPSRQCLNGQVGKPGCHGHCLLALGQRAGWNLIP